MVKYGVFGPKRANLGGVAKTVKIRRKIHLLEAPFFEKSWFFGFLGLA